MTVKLKCRCGAECFLEGSGWCMSEIEKFTELFHQRHYGCYVIHLPPTTNHNAIYIEAIMKCAAEVRTHWNNADAEVNQRDQALRSAEVLVRMAERVEKGEIKP